MINEDRFKILCGYYDKAGFHPQGGGAISLEQMLEMLNFRNIEDFNLWYGSVPNKEELVKDWSCNGNCCQSLLKKILQITQ